MAAALGYDNSVHVGYAWVSTRTHEHQAQLMIVGATIMNLRAAHR